VSYAVSSDAKERVRQALDIVDLVRDYLGEVHQSGRNYTALCPWHSDTRPSLTINPERQSFKCWVCDIGGDIFSFLMQLEGLSFPEALRALAERAGVDLPAYAPGSRSGEKKLSLYDVMVWAEGKYHECLTRLPEGEPARKYLAGRGIDKNSISRFHLGAAPDSWTWLGGQARRDGIDLGTLTEAGVLGRSSNGGRHFDRFNGRLLFSIRDARGRPVGFGGRVLPEFADRETAKYINSPETPLFSKHKLLYGLDVARDAIRRGRTAVVVEGYTDCIAAHQSGIDNVVAVLGTALGETHVKELGRLAETIVLVLDGDDAGRRRASEVLELFVAQQVDLRILTLPDDLDPCDYLAREGAEAFRQAIDGAADALEHKLRSVTNQLTMAAGTHQAHAALEDVLATLAKAPRLDERTPDAADLRQARILTRLAHLSGIDEATIRRRLGELRKQAARRRDRSERAAPPITTGPGGPPANRSLPRSAGGEATDSAVADATTTANEVDPTDRRWERLLLETLLLATDKFAEVRRALAPEQFRSPECRAIFSACCTVNEGGRPPSFDRVMLAIDDPHIQNVLVGLDEQGQNRTYSKQSQDVEALLAEILASFRGRQTAWDNQIPEDQAQDAILRLIEVERARQGT